MPKSVARQKAKNVAVGVMETLGLGVVILLLMLAADWTYDAIEDPVSPRTEVAE